MRNKITIDTIKKYRIFWIIPIAILALFAEPIMAQTLSLNFGQGGGSVTARLFQLIVVVTVLSIAPSILVMMTSFTRIVVVLSFLRQAIGTQTAPPNMVIIALAVFLTFFVMEPTFTKIYNDAVIPLIAQKITEEVALERAIKPMHAFMSRNVGEKEIGLFLNLANIDKATTIDTVPLRVLLPAFMISEVKRAFEIGFLIFVPFLVIDMAIASILVSMGMQLLPPAAISLPFKIIFFVMVDGWVLICGSLVQSFK